MTATTRRPSPRARRARKTSLKRWAGFIAIPAALLILVILSTLDPQDASSLERAVPFELTNTEGQVVALDDALDKGDVLLYFSMGVGCDGCFAQIPEIEAGVRERGLALLPVMVDPPTLVAAEAARFGIETPILIDPGAWVSQSYGMVGVYGHADRPSHSFALVRQDGTVGWVRHYAEMYVPADAFFGEMDSALEA